MRAKLDNAWENLQASLWFLPTLFILGAVALSMILGAIDTTLSQRRSNAGAWFFSGTADAAQALLAVIAGSLITAISIAYSVTIIALQQMSAQFTPRVLRTFTADRGNQVVLGAYIGTFIYALLVLRQVRNEESGVPFVPAISVWVGLILALVCLGLLIYFIHHISQLLQVSIFMDNVHDALIAELDEIYPTGFGRDLDESMVPTALVGEMEDASGHQVLRAREAGYLRNIDAHTLFEVSDGIAPWVFVRPRVGSFVPHGCVLTVFPGDVPLDEQQAELLRSAFVLDTERTLNQDPLFGIRQLVDIALKALSPAINDPTTAEYSLSNLGDVIGRLGERPFPSSERLGPDGATHYIFSRPTWEDFVDAAFSQIRRQAFDNVHVTSYLLGVLYEVARCLPAGPRGQAIQSQVDEVRHALTRGQFSPAEVAAIQEQCARVEMALRSSAPEPIAADA